MEKISVTIIALNEEDNIRDCLESVKWADEILVSDSGSADSTVDICREYGAEVYKDKWLGFGKQKNLIGDRAKNRWVLNIDADERVSAELKDEILKAVGSNGADGYYIARKNYFGKRWIKHCGWYPDYNLRLYRKDKGRFNERSVHEAVAVKGRKEHLENPFTHHTYKDVADYLERMQRYSTLAAREMFDNGRKAGMTDILLRPFFTFFKMFVIKGGFLDGAAGAVLSFLYAAYTLSKYAKLWEMKNNPGRVP
ncbi:MAG: glycosyltransferase family 2 protein [Deltaproteobacteria bacterium]|nr:glycosyltransferase family 2 protein [Deltaproteobacteria bacterium]